MGARGVFGLSGCVEQVRTGLPGKQRTLAPIHAFLAQGSRMELARGWTAAVVIP